jgi:hypothetical protein
MNVQGKGTIQDFFGDFIVFRDLRPLEPQLPGLEDLRGCLTLPEHGIPRKIQPAYGDVIAELLRRARELRGQKAPLRRLVYVGDTRLSDITAFEHISRAGDWPGTAYIVAETAEGDPPEVVRKDHSHIHYVSRWEMLLDFEPEVPVDERTAVIFDLDKTTLGARGRNDRVINQARQEAVRLIVAELLEEQFDGKRFQDDYEILDQPAYHPFTEDNQDHVAYLCLMLGTDLISRIELLAGLRKERFTSFRSFLAYVEKHKIELPDVLRDIHEQVYERVQDGDPTPFKAFRRKEYLSTVQRMGNVPDDTPLNEMLEEEIVITAEVREAARKWKRRGALLFGLSDKPDEASLPLPEQAEEGYLPLHRVRTHVVGHERS